VNAGNGLGIPRSVSNPMTTEYRRMPVYVAASLSGVAISVAWWFPDTMASAILGWVAACLLVFVARARNAYIPAYCCGLVLCAMGFYWVLPTVAAFGGMGAFAAALLFAAFVFGSAVQLLVFAFFHNNLGSRFDAFALRAPTALVLSELVAVRIFQWHYGHTQIALTPLVQIADIGGAMLVSFLMFWVAEAGVRVVVFRERRWSFLLPLFSLGISLVYGIVMMGVYSSPAGEPLDVVLVQGNLPVEHHSDRRVVGRNAAKLLRLSRQASKPGALIVWPESSLPIVIPDTVRSAKDFRLLPWIGDGSAFLVGADAEDSNQKQYIAAFVIQPDGSVPRPYYKQVLIPFGEYTPGSALIPWLHTMNTNAREFSAGREARVFELHLSRPDGSTLSAKVAPLICYEDTLPALSCRATRMGAELLVNLTNDAWFGRTAASYEHHLIASFRAIENRRFLVRATSTGLSAVVDPLGRTTVRLPIFTEKAETARVTLLGAKTAYTTFVGDWPWWILLALSVVAIGRARSKRTRTSDELFHSLSVTGVADP
jgi:apolipoprotein N-acyltransferase